MGRLNEVKKNGEVTATYFYDTNGNRDSVVTPTGTTRGTYDAQDRMLTYGNAQYIYTDNGELRAKIEGIDTTWYRYDNFGNLTQVLLPDGTNIEYLVDGENRRIGRKINGILTNRYLYASLLSPVAETDGAGNIIARYVYATHLNVPEYVTIRDSIYRIITDHHGSVRIIVNTRTGNIVRLIDYDVFGKIIYDNNPGFTAFGYEGGIYDIQTELVRYGARDYIPEMGRWATKDPIGFVGGLNFMNYCGADPINSYDPFGLGVGDQYPTQDAAARAALQGIYCNTIHSGHEYGGWIYVNPNGTYSYTQSVEGESDHIPTESMLAIKPPNPMAGYHSHVHKGNETFSTVEEGGDIAMANDYTSQHRFYLVTPSGIMKAWKGNKRTKYPLEKIEKIGTAHCP